MSPTQRRSLLSSLFIASVEVVVFALCTVTLAQPLLVFARWIVGASGSACTYFLNRRWAFVRRDVPKRQQARRYAATVLTAVSLATGVWWLAVHLTPIDPRVAHVASMMGVWWVFTFPTMRRWVFARAPVSTPIEGRVVSLQRGKLPGRPVCRAHAKV